MRKNLLGIVFAAALLLGSTVPLVGVGDVHADKPVAGVHSSHVTGPPTKVEICHRAGTPAERTMEVPAQAVPGHEGHGDTTGAC